MNHWKLASSVIICTTLALAVVACLPGGSREDSTPTPAPTVTVQTAVQATPASAIATATATPWPSVVPAMPLTSAYVVQPGDYPLLIAEKAGIPPAQIDTWIIQMLFLNGVDATTLQVGQELLLPPLLDGSVPAVSNAPSTASAPSVGGGPSTIEVQPAVPIPSPTLGPAFTPGGTPGTGSAAPPFAPTPPFVAFVTPTVTPTLPAAPTSAPGTRAWLTSSEESALYYYCDLDDGWHSIPPEKLLAFDSEQQLIAIWGRFRTKAPDSKC